MTKPTETQIEAVAAAIEKAISDEGDALERIAKAAIIAAALTGECHPAACRDELLWRNQINITIERCAQVADNFNDSPEGMHSNLIAAAIRKLKSAS